MSERVATGLMRFGRLRQTVSSAGEEPVLMSAPVEETTQRADRGSIAPGPSIPTVAASAAVAAAAPARGALRTTTPALGLSGSTGAAGGEQTPPTGTALSRTSSGSSTPAKKTSTKHVAFSEALETTAGPSRSSADAASAAVAAAEAQRLVAALEGGPQGALGGRGLSARVAAATAVAGAAQRGSGSATALASAGAVTALCQLLSEPTALEGTGEAAAAAARGLTALAAAPDAPAAALSAGAPQALNTALQVQSPTGGLDALNVNVRADVADAMAALCRRSADFADACAVAGAVGSLMNMMFRGTSADRSAAAAAMARIADASAKLQEEVLDGGSPEPLLALLRDLKVPLGGRSAAALAIASLSKGRAVHGTRLGSAVQHVVALLREADAQDARKSGATAKSGTAAAPAGGSTMPQQQPQPPAAVDAVKNSQHGGLEAVTSSVRERAVLALSRLVVGSTEAKQMAMRSGAVPVLIAILHARGTRSELKASTAKCLANLAAGTLDAAAASAAAAEAMPALLHVLRTGNSSSRDGAAAALANFVAAGGAGAAKSAISANVLPSLTEALARDAATATPSSLGSAAAQQPASSVVAACRNICGCGPDACAAVHASGATQHIIALVKAHKPGSPGGEGAMRAFGALAVGSPEACTEAVDSGLVPFLATYISSSAASPACRDAACAALGAALGCSDKVKIKAKAQAMLANVSTALVERLMSGMAPEGRPASAAAAASCLAPLVAGDKALSLAVARAGAITPLVALLNAGDGRTLRPHAEAALKALSLAGGPGVRELVAREQCVGPLLMLLDDLSSTDMDDFGGVPSFALAPLPDKQLLDAVIGTESFVQSDSGPLAFFDQVVLFMSRPTDALLALGPGLMDILQQLSPFKPFGGAKITDGSAAAGCAANSDSDIASKAPQTPPPPSSGSGGTASEPPPSPETPSPTNQQTSVAPGTGQQDDGFFRLPGLALPPMLDVGAFFNLIWQQTPPPTPAKPQNMPVGVPTASPATAVKTSPPAEVAPSPRLSDLMPNANGNGVSPSSVGGGLPRTSSFARSAGSASSSSFASIVNALATGEVGESVDAAVAMSANGAAAHAVEGSTPRSIQF